MTAEVNGVELRDSWANLEWAEEDEGEEEIVRRRWRQSDGGSSQRALRV